MLPFEIVVFGTPISDQGTKEARKRWQDEVRGAARKKWAEELLPTMDPVTLRVAYFYLFELTGDLDNLVKPIQDALERIVYLNDRQVVDLIVSARPKANYRIDVSPTLAEGLSGDSDFIHVVVDHTSAFEVYR